MMHTTKQAQIGPQWYLGLFLVGLFGFLFHEIAHWMTGTLLGESMYMTLNKAGPVDGNFASAGIYQIISAAGPLFTIGVALTGAWLALKKGYTWAYALVYSSFLMRLMAFAVSFMNLNDEARISVYFGWPWFVLPALVNLALLWLTVHVSRRLNIGWRTNLIGYVVISLVITIMVGADIYIQKLT